MTDPRADGLGVSTCIEAAIRDARIERDQVNYINAHATRWAPTAAITAQPQSPCRCQHRVPPWLPDHHRCHHGRSTLVGDIAEVKAVKQVFSNTSHIKMNATKSLIGHCLGAAGGMEAIAVIKVRPPKQLLAGTAGGPAHCPRAPSAALTRVPLWLCTAPGYRDRVAAPDAEPREPGG